MENRYTTVRLSKFATKVRIAHANLPADERIENETIRDETLLISVSVTTRNNTGSQAGPTWNYSSFVRHLRNNQGILLREPIEDLIQNYFEAVRNETLDKELSVERIKVEAIRPELTDEADIKIEVVGYFSNSMDE